MRFHHIIEMTDSAENPVWQPVAIGEELDDHDGTSSSYGRAVLCNWITDQQSQSLEDPAPPVDEYGNPYLRCVVLFSDDPEESTSPVAIVGSDELDEPSAELDAVDAARDAKLYARYLDRLADRQLEDALTAAHKAGHSKNSLARRVEPAVSRPIALRLMS